MAILNSTTISGSLAVTGDIKENGTLLVNKYLGLTAKAADSDKLDGHDSTYFYPASNPNGYTSNAGTVIGSGLTANTFVVGNGTVNVKTSTMQPTTSSTTWSTTSDVNVPTMKAISAYVTGLGYTSNEGTVTSVGAGTGLSISGTASVNPTVNIHSDYKLPTATEWASKANDSDVVHKTDNETIGGQKTFSNGPVISNIVNASKNGAIAQFYYGTESGTTIASTGHFMAYGDDDDSNSYKPTDKIGMSDTDTYYFNTGITVTDSDGTKSDVKLSFPPDSGTLATFEKMQGIFYCNTGGSTAAKTASCDSFTSLTSNPDKWYIMRVNYDNTSTSTLTLNVNGTGAKTLYINDNYTPSVAFTSGTYIGYYNTYWYFYSLIPTSTVSTKKYLLASDSKTYTNHFNTNSDCYMSSGHLFSNSNRVLEHVDASSWGTNSGQQGPSDPRQYSGNNIIKYFQFNYGAYSILIVYGLINKSTTTSTVSFGGKTYAYIPIVLTSLMVNGDTQTQRGAPSSVTKTGFSMTGNSGQAVAFVAIGITG